LYCKLYIMNNSVRIIRDINRSNNVHFSREREEFALYCVGPVDSWQDARAHRHGDERWKGIVRVSWGVDCAACIGAMSLLVVTTCL
jgi:hypothetical protein